MSVRDLFDTITTPSGAAVALLSALVGALASHILSRISKRRDDRKAQAIHQQEKRESARLQKIKGVVDKYINRVPSRDPVGIQGFIQAGAALLNSNTDLLHARSEILAHNRPDPMAKAPDFLHEEEFLPFIRWQATVGFQIKDYQNENTFSRLIERFRQSRIDQR